jgi:hypothetical protein
VQPPPIGLDQIARGTAEDEADLEETLAWCLPVFLAVTARLDLRQGWVDGRRCWSVSR